MLVLAVSMIAHGQDRRVASVHGKISNSKGEPLAFAHVFIDSLKLGAVADAEGLYVMRNIPAGTFSVSASNLGYKKQTQTVIVTGQQVSLSFILPDEVNTLGEVTVTAERVNQEAQAIKESGFNVNVIETKKFENTIADINQILNQTTGVRIRETGGMGSDFSFYLNGLSGKQVKFFLNGEPLENYGATFNLNNIPANLVERIEVYKGAVPVSLGADALGGAVNIVTKQGMNNFMDVSYSYGSFNTTRANLAGQWRNASSGFTIRPKLFYNYSDNNYTMYKLKTRINIEEDSIVDAIGNFKRFHSGYQSYMSDIELGFTQKKWADKLLVGVGFGSVRSEAQTGSSGSKNLDGSFNVPVIGEAFSEERTQKYTLQYAKNKFLKQKMSVNMFASYSIVNSENSDISSNRYSWNGKILSSNNPDGELEVLKILFNYRQEMFLQNTGLTYQFNEHHQLSGNVVWSFVSRQGRNVFRDDGDLPFGDPNTLEKKVFGLAYQNSIFDHKLQTTISGKYYDMNILARESRQYVFGQFTIVDLRTQQQRFGGSIVSRFKMDNWLIKASYEYAYRLPEAYELFGDGLRTLANPELLPESSHNINVGGSYEFNAGKSGKVVTEVNGFVRDVDNTIFGRPGGAFLQYLNVQKIFIRGIEAEARYQYKNSFEAGINVSYQDVLNNNKYTEGTTSPNFFYRDRMYNTPYLFGNADMMYTITNVGKHNLKVSLMYNLNYVNKFYLSYPRAAQGGAKFIVPTQLIHNTVVTVSTKDNRVNLSFECRNLTNALAYDNYALQKPGRAFYIKLRYFLFSKN